MRLEEQAALTERYRDLLAVEFREGVACSFMLPRALALWQEIMGSMTVVVNTLRGETQAHRVTFIQEGKVRWLCVRGGLSIYRDGELSADWEAQVKAHLRGLPLSLEQAMQSVQSDLNALTLAPRIPQMAVFYVGEGFSAELYQQKQRELAGLGWDLFHQRRKLYLRPLGIDKGSGLKFIAEQEGDNNIATLGDSYFDLPMLAVSRWRFAPAGSELDKLGAGGITFSRLPLPQGTEEILQEVLRLRQE
jgi:hypothetical protein